MAKLRRWRRHSHPWHLHWHASVAWRWARGHHARRTLHETWRRGRDHSELHGHAECLLRRKTGRRRRRSKDTCIKNLDTIVMMNLMLALTCKLPLIRALERHHSWCHRRASAEGHTRRSRWRSSRRRKGIVLPCLGRQKSFSSSTMSFAFSVLLKRILDLDSLVHEELVIHRLNCCVRRLKVGKCHKAISLRLSSCGVPRHLAGNRLEIAKNLASTLDEPWQS